MVINPDRYHADKELVRSAMKDDCVAEESLAKYSNDRRRNAHTQARTDRRQSPAGELLRRKPQPMEIMRDEMANHPGYDEANKSLPHSATKSDFIVDKYLANYPNDCYWDVQTILDRRNPQARAFWRNTQAGELLRRELSLVEISCVVFMLSAMLANYY